MKTHDDYNGIAPKAIVRTDFKINHKLIWQSQMSCVCVNNWKDSLGKWRFLLQKRHTQRTHTYFLVLNFVHCVLYPIHVCLVTNGTTRRSTAQPPLHHQLPELHPIFFFFYVSLKLNYRLKRHDTFSRLLASIQAIQSMRRRLFCYSLTSAKEGKRNIAWIMQYWLVIIPFFNILSLGLAHCHWLPEISR